MRKFFRVCGNLTKKAIPLNALLIASLAVVVLYTYFPLTKTFYQQDEWLGFGSYLANGAGYIFSSTEGILSLILAQGRIFSGFVFYLFVKFFPLSIVPFAIFTIVFHSLNVVLIFLLGKKIFKRVLPAFLGSLFFALSSVSQSAVTWPATSINTLPSTTLILMSLFFYFNYLNLSEKKWLLPSFLLIYLSLFFKETGIFLFLLLPLSALIFKRFTLAGYIKTFWYYFLGTGLIITFRLLQFMYTPHQQALFLTGSSKYLVDSLIVR